MRIIQIAIPTNRIIAMRYEHNNFFMLRFRHMEGFRNIYILSRRHHCDLSREYVCIVPCATFYAFIKAFISVMRSFCIITENGSSRIEGNDNAHNCLWKARTITRIYRDIYRAIFHYFLYIRKSSDKQDTNQNCIKNFDVIFILKTLGKSIIKSTYLPQLYTRFIGEVKIASEKIT